MVFLIHSLSFREHIGKEDAVYMSDISLDDLSFSMEPDCACEEPNLTDDREEEM